MATAALSRKSTVSIQEARDLRKQRIEETFQLDPQVRITLKGTVYILELNNFAVKGVLKDTGYNVMATSFGIEAMQDPAVMGSLLYWGLLTNQPDLTQDDVDKLYTYRHYPYVLEKLRVSLDLFLPDMSDIVIESKPVAGEEDQDPR